MVSNLFLDAQNAGLPESSRLLADGGSFRAFLARKSQARLSNCFLSKTSPNLAIPACSWIKKHRIDCDHDGQATGMPIAHHPVCFRSSADTSYSPSSCSSLRRDQHCATCLQPTMRLKTEGPTRLPGSASSSIKSKISMTATCLPRAGCKRKTGRGLKSKRKLSGPSLMATRPSVRCRFHGWVLRTETDAFVQTIPRKIPT